MKKERAVSIDAWRGVAISAMVLYHALLVLNFFGGLHFNIYGGWSLLFARLVQWSFLLLVGIGMLLSYQLKEWESPRAYILAQLRRAGIIAFWAVVISVVTWLVVPEVYIRFGILHLIAVSIVLCLPLALYPRLIIPALLLTLVAVEVLNNFPTFSEVLHAIGFPLYSGAHFWSLDFFPIVPWVFCVQAGVGLGVLMRKPERWKRIQEMGKQSRVAHSLAAAGRHSLKIYVTHVPLLLALFYALGLIDISI